MSRIRVGTSVAVVAQMKRAIGFGSFLSAVLPLLAVLLGGCERSEQLRSTMEADRLGWQQRISSLKARAAHLDGRLRSLPAETRDTTIASSSRRRRVAALVVGSRESLFDLDRNVEDGVRAVEAAIARGSDEGEATLTTVAESIDSNVRQQEQSVIAAEAAMAQIEEAR